MKWLRRTYFVFLFIRSVCFRREYGLELTIGIFPAVFFLQMEEISNAIFAIKHSQQSLVSPCIESTVVNSKLKSQYYNVTYAAIQIEVRTIWRDTWKSMDSPTRNRINIDWYYIRVFWSYKIVIRMRWESLSVKSI